MEVPAWVGILIPFLAVAIFLIGLGFAVAPSPSARREKRALRENQRMISSPRGYPSRLVIEDDREMYARLYPRATPKQESCYRRSMDGYVCNRRFKHAGLHVEYTTPTVPRRYWVRHDKESD